MSRDSVREIVQQIYDSYGPRKPMGAAGSNRQEPHFFLVRSFLGDIDLAILFNTKRCKYQCKFCNLPAKSSRDYISAEDVTAQFIGVLHQSKNAIGVIERLTIANEGSVFDFETFPRQSLHEIVQATSCLPGLSRIVVESRLEFVASDELTELKSISGKTIDVLTGFETVDERIRDEILGKREPLEVFLNGLEQVAAAKCALTAYVLYKPDPCMTDQEACAEAERSIDYLVCHTRRLGIPLCIRLNPMYAARGTIWAHDALIIDDYLPPKLSDVLNLARKKDGEGIPVYIGLTSEGLADPQHTYRIRDDFNGSLLKTAIQWNRRKTVVSRICP